MNPMDHMTTEEIEVRDMFAAVALLGLLISVPPDSETVNAEEAVSVAWKFADKMLEYRREQP